MITEQKKQEHPVLHDRLDTRGSETTCVLQYVQIGQKGQ